MAQKSFSAAVDEWVAATEARMTAVFRLSAEYVIENVIELTPVRTGFLRASLAVTTDGPLPIRSDAKPSEGGTYQSAPYSLVISGADLGQTIHASFTAAYAAHIEYGTRAHMIYPKDRQALRFYVGGASVFAKSVKHPGTSAVGMVRRAAQNWPQHVDRAVAAAKARVRSRQN